MPISADKPHLWKKDIVTSVDFFNRWFIRFAPAAYRKMRAATTDSVLKALRLTQDLRATSPQMLEQHPGILQTLRMATSPPLARDRLVGLADSSKNLVHSMEKGNIPPRMTRAELRRHLSRICRIVRKLADRDIFPWLGENKNPTARERRRASTIVADRLCGAVADPIIRNAQEQRQLRSIGGYLRKMGYREKAPLPGGEITEMEPGSFTFHLNVPTGRKHRINMPIDVVIQPKKPRKGRFPLLIEAKSAGDFTNTNKRRKEEATKIRQLRDTYGKHACLVLFLCGYFDSGYLGYEAAEGLDWIWEHRIDDLKKLGLRR